jgi:hypothetical protein
MKHKWPQVIEAILSKKNQAGYITYLISNYMTKLQYSKSIVLANKTKQK